MDVKEPQEPNDDNKPPPDPDMMAKLMASMGSGAGGDGGGMDMASLQSMLAGMGGGGGGGGGMDGPPASLQQQAQRNRADAAEKNAGEKDGGADGKKWRWEQTSKYGESEVIVRFALAAPVTKKDVKISFKAKSIEVVVAGDELLSGKTYGATHPDDSTWCLVEEGSELQVMLALAEDTKWHQLLAE
mmetsp:Transcript_25720/g.42478  ORF Transcript_25720/g.42478 Transcript_25720/m.42478 type:complete len:187 (+) Transcript_25720:78-638(+)|eukprot:CAMPEP_0119301040 /NCGR_PEP_ID=MMETSP1333-20130426/2896_1 /TAXON_ID=418940 /ORGANISM="Scyphosphaera apsteinii, Strain RCC1455" /LENGTH=186 /DNA_ID=CAMNT_0007303013 /DNA_START=88 /DNA_END=648 /DNA_ORIENTATION=+